MEGRPKSFGKRRSLRLRTFDYRSPGPYHVTVGTFRRQPLLTAQLVEGVSLDLATVARETGTAVYAYCFMPDHAHLLVSLSGEQDLLGFVHRFKGRSTRTFWRCGGRGKLWQRSFHDHVLRSDEDLQAIARYIIANPVRRGLVQDVRDYPGVGSLVFSLDDL